MKFDLFKKTALAALAAYAAASLSAQEDDDGWRADVLYGSSQVFRGVERTNASAQATVEFARENFRASAWTNQPFARDSDEAREVNLTAAYTWQPASPSAVAFEFSVTQAWFENVPGGGVKCSLEASVSATLPMLAVAEFVPMLRYARDFRFEADTVEAMFARSIALTRLGTFLDLNCFVGWSAGENWRPDATGLQREDGYGYWGGEVRVPYRIGRFTTVVAGLHYAGTFGRSVANGPFGTGSKAGLWVTFGVNLDF